MHQKRIAFVTPYYFPISGGYSSYTYNACKALTTMGHEVTIYAPFVSSETTSSLFAERHWAKTERVKNSHLLPDKKIGIAKQLLLMRGVNILFYPAMMMFSTSFDQHLAKELKREKYDVINTLGFPQRIIPLGFDTGARKLHTFCTQPVKATNTFERIYLKALFSSVDVVTAVSAALCADVRRFFGVHVDKVLYPCIDTQVFKPDGKALKKEYFSIGVVSQFYWPLKVEGIKLLLKSLYIFKKTSKVPFKLFIAGSGPLQDQLTRTVKDLEIKDNVVFVGSVHYSDMPSFFTTIDVYAHISFQEALGISVLEAMACGKPVVASQVGGLPEIVDERVGWLTKNDSNHLCRVLIDSMNPDAIKQKGANARRRIERDFSLGSFARCFESITI